MSNQEKDLFRVRVYLSVVLVGILFSCQMILFVEPEIQWIDKAIGQSPFVVQHFPQLSDWIGVLRVSVTETYQKYPVMAYCMDWLAFAHVFIAVALLGAIRNPVQNVWVVKTALITTLLMIPFTFISGGIRGIPCYWLLLDSSFAMIAILPLVLALRGIKRLR